MFTAKKIFKAKFLATRAKVSAMTLDKIKYYDEELSYDRSFDDYTNRLIRKRANDAIYRYDNEFSTELPDYPEIDALQSEPFVSFIWDDSSKDETSLADILAKALAV